MAYDTSAKGVIKTGTVSGGQIQTGSNLNMGDFRSKIYPDKATNSNSISMSELYRQTTAGSGSISFSAGIRDCRNNQFVPSSGEIKFTQLQGACRYIECKVTSDENRLNASLAFRHYNNVWNGSSFVNGEGAYGWWNEWGEKVDKLINLDADIYSNNSTSALTIPSGEGGGGIRLLMNGNGVYGYRGSGGNEGSRGQDGFAAIYTQDTLIFESGSGSLYGGGGGGGGGGRGGREGNDGKNNRNYCCGWFCPQCSSCDRGVGGGGDGGGSGGRGGAGAWYTTGRQGGQGGNNPGNGGGGGGSGGSGGNLGNGGGGGNGGQGGSTGPGGNCQGGGGGSGGQGGGGSSNGGHYLIGSNYTSVPSAITKGGRVTTS